MAKKFEITVTEDQLATMSAACDLFMRVGIGQLTAVIDHLGHMPGGAATQRIFDDLIEIQRLVTARPQPGGPGLMNPIVPETFRIAHDISAAAKQALTQHTGHLVITSVAGAPSIKEKTNAEE